MQALIWAASGILAGWFAGRLIKGRDYGLVGNLILGLLGGLVGGWLVHLLGFASPKDHLRHAVVSILGAMVVLAIACWLKPVSRQTQKVLGKVGSVADLEAQIRRLGNFVKDTLARFLGRGTVPRDPNVAFDEQLTFGQRLADDVAKFGGSWTFIGLFWLFMLVWMIINSVTPRHFDPYPFILLNLVLSCLAALQAPVIMMSQNRQNSKDRLMASHDYDVNLRAGMEITSLHARFDDLRDRDWAELVTMQQRQIELLENIVRDLRPRDETDQKDAL